MLNYASRNEIIWRMEVQLHAFLTSELDGVESGQFHAPATLLPEESLLL